MNYNQKMFTLHMNGQASKSFSSNLNQQLNPLGDGDVGKVNPERKQIISKKNLKAQDGDRVTMEAKQKQVFGEQLEEGGDANSYLIRGSFKISLRDSLIGESYLYLCSTLRFHNKNFSLDQNYKQTKRKKKLDNMLGVGHFSCMPKMKLTTKTG